MKVKIREQQLLVREFQRLAGQPVADKVSDKLPPFFANQMRFVRSEWFDEFLSRWQAGKRLNQTLVAVADDLADTLFTVLGATNVLGCTLSDEEECYVLVKHPSPLSISCQVSGFLTEASMTTAPRSVVVALREAIAGLFFLSSVLNIDLILAHRIVARANMTKLWSKEDFWMAGYPGIADSAPVGGSFSVNINGRALTATRTDYKDDKCFRVTDEYGKLQKSPSFKAPDVSPALSLS
jgi:hypothetical protein